MRSVKLLISFLFVTALFSCQKMSLDEVFEGSAHSGEILIYGNKQQEVDFLKSQIDSVLRFADPRIREGVERQNIKFAILPNEDSFENEQIMKTLFKSRPLEIIYNDIDGVNEVYYQNSATVAGKLMQLFACYTLELDSAYSDIKAELKEAFKRAIAAKTESGAPLYHSNSKYFEFDEAYDHLKAPYFTAPGAYLGTAYEIYSGRLAVERGDREYYPVSRAEMQQFDSLICRFLKKYMGLRT